MNKHETKCLLGLALANWPRMQDKDFNVSAIAALWYKLLGHLPYEVAEAGLAKVLLTAKFFPTVAEVLQAASSIQAKPGDPPPPEEAWDEVCRNLDPYRSHQWSHETIRLTVQRLGGIRSLCESETLAADRAHFFKLYDMQINHEKEKTLNKQVVALISRTEIKLIK